MKQNIYYVGARESSTTPNIDSIAGPLDVAEVNIEPDNQQTHKITQPIQNDIDNENTTDKTHQTAIDINQAKKIRFSNIHNAMIGHLNINSIRNKLHDLKILSKDLTPTVLAISETKVDASFPNVQFLLDDYFNPGDFRKDRTSHGGGLMIYIRKGTPCKRLQQYEEKNIESICFEIAINKRKWLIFAIYRPPYNSNLQSFFQYLNRMTDKAFDKYENIIILGDINIDIKRDKGEKSELFSHFCETFSFKNMIKADTCFTKTSSSSVDILLTNQPRYFMHSLSIETGISDVHTLIVTHMRAHIKKLKPIQIQYRSYKNYDENYFLADLSNTALIESKDNPDKMYNELTTNFTKILDKHAPIKHKIVRGNNADFMNRELQKAIMKRSRLKNKFNRHKSNENWEEFRKQRNLCTKIKRKAKISHFENLCKNPSSNEFWKTVKPFITDKGHCTSEDYMLEENNDLIKDDKKISNLFNDFFVNIIERSTGKKPATSSKDKSLEEIISTYKDHPSIKSIKEQLKGTGFSMPAANEENIHKILASLDPKKAAGNDLIPPKVVVKSAGILSKPLTDVINATITKGIFPSNAKLASVKPIYKKGSRLDVSNYRPISVISAFSKVMEKHFESSMVDYINSILSQYLSGFRKGYSCQHLLLRFTEEWRKYLDQNKIVGALLMDLSKAFDCLPHDLLIAKLEAYGFDTKTLNIFKSYLNQRKQFVNINGTLSDILEILSGVPQGSILGPILFNIFINDLLIHIKSTNTHNYADDNTLSAYGDTVIEVTKSLEKGAEEALSWFLSNGMSANADKFQAIFCRKDKKALRGFHS